MRLKKEDELIYNEKLSEALKEYRKRCNEYDLPPPNWFIEKFNLKRNGEYITAKRWYNIIYKRNDLDSKMSLLRKRNHAILTDLEAGVSHKKICITYNITDDQLNQLVRKRKSPLKKRSLMLLEEVCSLYKDGKSIGFIEKKLGISTPTIRKLLDSGEIKTRTQSETSVQYKHLNSEYFKIVDSKEKAWVLGLIFADGSINQTNSLQVSQSVENDHLLQIIADELNYPGKFTTASKSHTEKLQSTLTISRKTIFSDLMNLGLTQNKENELRFPFSKLSNEHFWAFLSGFYNGDGGLTFGLKLNTRTKADMPSWIPSLGWQITSTKEMCEDIACFLQRMIPNIKTSVRKEGSKNAWRVSISSSRSHILQVVHELNLHGHGIQVTDKYDKAVFYQRRLRRTTAIKAVRAFSEANLLKNRLKDHVDNLIEHGMMLKDVASNLNTDRNSLRKYYKGSSYPSTRDVIIRLSDALDIDEKDFIDWSLLEAHNLISKSWDLKNPSYHYYGKRVGLFGEIIELGHKRKWVAGR